MPPDSTTELSVPGEGEQLNAGNISRKVIDVRESLTRKSLRTSFPQVLATMAQSLLLFALGMLISAPTVVIGALRNASTGISLSDQQASWFAGVLLIMQPVGSLLSGALQDWLGRKKCMMLVNIPQLMGWILIRIAPNYGCLLAAAVLMGFSVGFMEAPTLSYVGEISQPHLRGTLASFTSVYVSSGTLTMFLLGTITDWRTAAAISTSVPIATIVAISQVPESPVWLAMKGRNEQALKALCWLRGWVKPEVVNREYQALLDHVEATRAAYTLLPTEPGAKPVVKKKQFGIMDKLRMIRKPEMFRPLMLVIGFFFFLHCASLNGSRPYLVHVFNKLGTPTSPNLSTVLAACLQIVGSLCCMSLVGKLGRRRLSILSMTLCSIICFLLGLYSFLHDSSGLSLNWAPLTLISLHFFCTNLGIGVVPWTLLSEVFPARGRGIGGGLSAAVFYVWFFLVTKTFIDLESHLQLYGVFFFYGVLGIWGIVFLYFYLPETEGRRLEDVEKLFQSKKKHKLPQVI